MDRYITLTISQAEFELLTEARRRVQMKLHLDLTWSEFVIELARGVL